MSDLPLSTVKFNSSMNADCPRRSWISPVLSGRSLMGTIARTRTTTSPAPGTGSGKSVS